MTPQDGAVVVLALTALLLAGPAPVVLARAPWLALRPRLLLAAWCAWGVAATLALAGCGGAAGAIVGSWLSGRQDDASAWSASVVGAVSVVGPGALWVLASGARSAVRIGRSRRRHQDAVQVVGTFDPRFPAWILDDDRPVAYAVPGRETSMVVLTRGALALSDRRELAAVVRHEREHCRRWISFVLTAWAVWARTWPVRSVPRRVLPAVELAAEMIADDAARRLVGPQTTIAAICRLQTGLPAACDELGWEPDPATMRRAHRLLAV